MALDATFQQLTRAIERWQEGMEALRLTAETDRPRELALADRYGNAVADQLGRLHEALESAQAAQQALHTPEQRHRVAQALAETHRLLNAAVLYHAEDLASSEQVLLLADVERRGAQWRCWTAPIWSSLRSLPRLAHAAVAACLDCWHGLSETSDGRGLHVTNTAIGQQFFRAAAQAAERSKSESSPAFYSSSRTEPTRA